VRAKAIFLVSCSVVVFGLASCREGCVASRGPRSQGYLPPSFDAKWFEEHADAEDLAKTLVGDMSSTDVLRRCEAIRHFRDILFYRLVVAKDAGDEFRWILKIRLSDETMLQASQALFSVISSPDQYPSRCLAVACQALSDLIPSWPKAPADFLSQIRKHLLQIAFSPRPSMVRADALGALAAFVDVEDAEMIIDRAAADPDDGVRGCPAVFDLIKRLPPERREKILVQLMRDASAAVRSGAAHTIPLLLPHPSESTIALLKRLAGDPNLLVSRAASDSLRLLRQRKGVK